MGDCINFNCDKLSLRSSSFVDLPPTFCVSRVLACYASVWGPEYLWTIALYWGYKIRNLLENWNLLGKNAVTSFSDDSLVFVSYFSGNPIKSELQGSILTAGMHLCLSVVAVLYLCRQPSDITKFDGWGARDKDFPPFDPPASIY